MQTKRWKFSPGFWPTVITILLFPALVSLGFWQLDRAGQKRDLFAQFRDRQAAEAVDLSRDRTIRHNKPDILWRHIKLTGYFDPEITILLDNQVMNGVPGYFVFSTFRLADDEWLLVNRGWLPSGADRSKIPEVNYPSGAVDLYAVATDVPATGILLGDNNIEKPGHNIFRLQKIDIDEVSKLTGLELLPFVARLEPGSDYGFVREWVLPGSGEEKHLGYAFQWFALALTLLIIFIAVNIRKPENEHE